MANFQEVAARAWQIGPTWLDILAISLVDVTLIWWWGVPGLVMVPLSIVATVALFGLLGWLELQNEAADAEYAENKRGPDREENI